MAWGVRSAKATASLGEGSELRGSPWELVSGALTRGQRRAGQGQERPVSGLPAGPRPPGRGEPGSGLAVVRTPPPRGLRVPCPRLPAADSRPVSPCPAGRRVAGPFAWALLVFHCISLALSEGQKPRVPRSSAFSLVVSLLVPQLKSPARCRAPEAFCPQRSHFWL